MHFAANLKHNGDVADLSITDSGIENMNQINAQDNCYSENGSSEDLFIDGGRSCMVGIDTGILRMSILKRFFGHPIEHQ